MSTIHPEFKAPDNSSALLWRYMDFVKFTSMLKNGGIFFARADVLGDPFEGSFPRANEALRPQRWAEKIPSGFELRGGMDQLFHEISERACISRPWHLISCWHMNQHESAAMWTLYGGKGDSIAVQTTYKTLFDSLPENTYVGMVQYIDYNTEEIPEWNGFTPFMHKRASYRHETEVRAIIKLRDAIDAQGLLF